MINVLCGTTQSPLLPFKKALWRLGSTFRVICLQRKHISDVQPVPLKNRLNGELPRMMLMGFAWLLIGFHLVYCLFFKFANGLDCKQSLGLDLDSLHAVRKAVLSNGQGAGLGFRNPEMQQRCSPPNLLLVTSQLSCTHKMRVKTHFPGTPHTKSLGVSNTNLLP